MNQKKRGDRRDGVWLKELDALHTIMPYVYPNRADNEAFISERIDLTRINRYLEEKNRDNPGEEYKLFHVLLAAMVKTITLRPKMNRFIQGYRIYQRNQLTAGFVVKKQFADEAHEALAYIAFDENSTLESVHKQVMDEIHQCRSDKTDNTTDGMEGLKKLPKPVLTFVMWLLRRLDFHGRAPEFLVKTDPNYATCFITNLGSIGLKSGYHHLSNWGTNSIFVVVGEKKLRPVYDEDGNMTMRETIDLGLTLDERLADGYYYSRTVKLLKYLLQNPELLELPANQEVDYDK
ncbi:MAG: hypothetical protein HFE73_03625 [Firmicutes bacterium]|nr:hypothetical protein [Bacillota bacterium]